MKHKILLLLFLFSLLPSWGWGQETEVTETIDFKEDKYKDGYTITSDGTYIVTGEYKGGPKDAVIKVEQNLKVTIILDNVTINLSDGCPLSAKDASKVNLLLKGINTLTTDYSYPGIWAPEKTNCGIIINELNDFKGSLEVKGDMSSGYGRPGIGGYYNNSDKKGYIIINGGNINAKGEVAAAIGGALNSSGGIIIINGGNITATSEYGAGIGSGENGSESEITINGGTVTATSKAGAGIGDGYYGSGSTFSTGDNGTAFINTNSYNPNGGISDQNYKKPDAKTKGLIFDGTEGAIYGESYTLTADAIIENGKTLTITKDQTLTIAEGATLTIAQGATLTNKGTIKCDGEINGTIGGDKKVQYAVTYDPNYNNLPADHIEYVESGKSLSTHDIKREYYNFTGWYKDSKDKVEVETITEAITVYAHWEPIALVTSDPIIYIKHPYGVPFELEITDNKLPIKNIEAVGGIKSIELITNNLFNNLSFKDSYLKGVPIKVDKTNISFKITAYNDATAEVVSIVYDVTPASLTIAPGESITKVYDGNNTVTTSNALKLEGVYSDDDVHLDSYKLTYDDEKAGIEKKITLPREYTLAGEKKDCYNLTLPAKGFALKGTITPAPLTITPKSNQKLFEGEAPAYEVLGEVNDEKPEFTGSLGVESGKVVINSLALTTEFAQNYSLSLTPEVPITIINNETAKSLVQLNGTTNANGAYIDEVTFTSPDGFEIALKSSTLKSSLNYSKSFTWNRKGTSILNFKLKRISDSRESEPFSMEITVESQYIPDHGGNDNNDSLIKEYNIEIPEVEGISVDKGFGDHWIKDWKDFSFIITVKEGYVENSDPEVTIKGYDFAFDALTDTTYECTIDHVFKNAKVIITGIVKDPPATANNAIKAPEKSWKIINGVAYITVAKPTVFAVVDMKGNIISTNKLAPGETPIYNLPRAKPIVFWFDKERAVKVIIK